MPLHHRDTVDTDPVYAIHAPIDTVAIERAARAEQGRFLAAVLRHLWAAMTSRPAARAEATGGKRHTAA